MKGLPIRTRRPGVRLVLVLLVLGTAGTALPAPAGPRARVHQVATATLERWKGVSKAGDVWRGVTITYDIVARRRVAEAGAIQTDEASLRSTRCVVFYERTQRNGSVFVYRNGKTIELSPVSDETCTRRKVMAALPDGAFTFDEDLEGGSLDALLGRRRFVIEWIPYGEKWTERRLPSAGWSGDLQEPRPEVTGLLMTSERDARVEGTIDGRPTHAPCGYFFWLSHCGLRTIHEVSA